MDTNQGIDELPENAGIPDGERTMGGHADKPSNIIPFPFPVRIECPDCRGKGLITIFAGRIKGESKCPRCAGDGKLRVK